ncbi:transmembrane protein 41B-like [Eubalaena glacialis]|uniref:transmembrane protein 41B-like n=1 Tax=Eubalaena glacialis TaxID=27606 RepID=UPI002A5A7336|nr:transmembrane protein 41B-like [Eubalaena glacialis]
MLCKCVGCSKEPGAKWASSERERLNYVNKAAMTKGRVVERSQTGALHTTPPGDKVAGPQGPSAPGSGDHLKEKACAEAGL